MFTRARTTTCQVKTISRAFYKAAIFFLCHSGVNKPWVENLAVRIEVVPYLDRYLGVVFDKWDFIKGKNVVTEIEAHIDQCRFIGVVVSKAMLESEWATMERTIAVSAADRWAGKVVLFPC